MLDATTSHKLELHGGTGEGSGGGGGADGRYTMAEGRPSALGRLWSEDYALGHRGDNQRREALLWPEDYALGHRGDKQRRKEMLWSEEYALERAATLAGACASPEADSTSAPNPHPDL